MTLLATPRPATDPERTDAPVAAAPAARRLRPWRVLVPTAALLAGLLFATSAATSGGTDLRGGRRMQLAELVGSEQNRVDGYRRTVTALRSDIEQAAERSAAGDSEVAAARTEVDRLVPFAGLEAVHGPGLTITLADAPTPAADGSGLNPGAATADVDPNDRIVHQQDVQAVVNALWAGGAEAMRLMDQRVISTSAVRCVGNTLRLQGRTYPPPYVITAVGDVDRLRAALAASPGVLAYRAYSDALGLVYTEKTHDDVTLPAYDGPVELVHARAGGS